jgi:UDP-N-acetylmuramoyl-tripeptide--D-alanyl-D-alanine ligase
MSSVESTIAAQAQKATFFSSDSRKVDSGCIFVALSGQKTDGHNFVEDLLRTKNPSAIWVDEKKNKWKSDPRVHSCSDPHEVHRLLAKHFRKKFQGRLLAVAGSSGKTSTKEFLASLLATKYKTVKTQASQNGHLGIPLTLEQLRPEVEMAVIEVGIDGPGDMIHHADIVDPDLCVMTSIGEEHLRLLGDLAGVFKEERVLADHCLRKGGKVFVPEADTWLVQIQGAQKVASQPEQLVPDIKVAWESEVMKRNLALACRVALEVGMTPAEIVTAARTIVIPPGRGVALEVKPALWIIEDHYNSNPSSLKSGLETAAKMARAKGLPLSLVLGDMLDLGELSENYHQELVDILAKMPVENLVLVGEEFAKAAARRKLGAYKNFPNSTEAAAKCADFMPARGLVLFKGSRGMALEKILTALKACH